MDLIFDIGGVLVHWNPAAILAGAFADPVSREIARTQVIEHPDWLALDRGTLTQPQAIDRAARRTGLPALQIQRLFDHALETLTPIEATARLLPRLLARGHRLYCLSNMPQVFLDHLERTCTFWDAFHGRIFSCQVKHLKPEPAIYQTLLDTYALDAANALFIDDLQVNLRAAAGFGIRTLHFENPAQCEAALQQLGLL